MGKGVVNKPVYGRVIQNKGVASYKKGGKVKKTGLAKLHKGEVVVSKKNKKKIAKAMGFGK